VSHNSYLTKSTVMIPSDLSGSTVMILIDLTGSTVIPSDLSIA
jgi:hypothetical protein